MKIFWTGIFVLFISSCGSNIELVNNMNSEFDTLLERQVDGRLTIDTVDHYESPEDKAFIDAYQKILAEFDKSRHYYKAISAQEWIEIANAIIAIDEKIDNGIGWGNLVLKFTFADFLMRTYMTIPLSQLSPDELAELLAVHDKVRHVIYPNLKAVRFAFSFYSDEPIPFDNWKLEGTVDNDLSEKDKTTIKLGEKLFPIERFKKILKAENTNLLLFTGSYKDLYLNPAPMSFIYAPRYFFAFWKLRYCTEKVYRLKTRSSEISENQVLAELVEEQFLPENVKWLPTDLSDSRIMITGRLMEELQYCDKR